MLKERYTKTVKVGKHLQQQPNDNEAKAEQTFYRESLARRIAQLRLDKQEHDLDKTCLKLLDELEKTACISNRLRKKVARYTAYFNRYHDNENSTQDQTKT